MNYVRKQGKTFRTFAAFVAAMVVLTLAGAAVPAQAQTYTDLYNFPGAPQAQYPNWMALGRDGNFYGGSQAGGVNGLGSIFKITPAGVQTVVWSETSNDGGPCYLSPTLGTDGNFYGSCAGISSGNGYIFKVTPGGTFTHLHTFTGTDGTYPGALYLGNDGNFYGITVSGGAHSTGTVFKITSAGVLTTIYSFLSQNGPDTPSTVIQGQDGNLYGSGGYYGAGGNVFKLTTGGVLTVLHIFNGGATDGSGPIGLTQGTDGNFYGMTQFGGVNNVGTVYKITPAGTFTLLHSFNVTADSGEYPESNLIQASDGNFYGAAVNCSSFGCTLPESIFKITPSGVFTVLAMFDGTHGLYPFPNIVQDPSGVLYGMTQQGGTSGSGVFYSLNNSLNAYAALVTTAGKEGAKIGILGQGFTSSTTVKFGGTPAVTVTRTGSTFLLATVPAGALTGSVTATTGSTTLTSSQTFKVTPTITSFSPPSGPVGTLVTINGTGLMQATKVTFNGKSASFTVVSDIEITATVPTGATTGKIKVTTKGGSATSATSFTVN